jgi:phage host-nuclease inhibitor protein Gam
MESKESYTEKIKTKVNAWSEELSQLRSRMDQAKADARNEYGKKIEELQAKKQTLLKRVDELMESEGEAWKGIKAGVEKVSSDLRKAIEKFRSSSN